uniref:Putative secreted protein n=1 Tax=Amblyomma cajennense TaxID=34607 RepID=A0A023FQG3_AMBCJ
MFFVFAVAAGVFLSMGLGGTTPAKKNGECPPPKTEVPYGRNKVLTIKGHTENCTCTLPGGQQGTFPDYTPCFGEKEGRRQVGNCSKGVCVTADSTHGCAGKNGTEEDSTINHELCIFHCKNDNGGIEWAFLPDGSRCVNKDEGEDQPKNGTCKHRPHRDNVQQKETVCFPNDKLYLVGC